MIRPVVEIEGRLAVHRRREGLDLADETLPLGGLEEDGADVDRRVFRRLRIVRGGLPEKGFDPVGGMVGACPAHPGETAELLRRRRSDVLALLLPFASVLRSGRSGTDTKTGLERCS